MTKRKKKDYTPIYIFDHKLNSKFRLWIRLEGYFMLDNKIVFPFPPFSSTFGRKPILHKITKPNLSLPFPH